MKDIAVLLATYNGERYIKEQLNSLFAQSRQDFRIVIHDDGSTDATLKIIAEYQKQYKNRIELTQGKSCGNARDNFIYLLGQVEADYYFLCDQDDVWLPDKIDKSIGALEDVTNDSKGECVPIIVFTDMYVTDESLKIIDDSFIRYLGRDCNNISYTQILIDNPASGTTLCFNRALRDIAISRDDIDWSAIPMHDAWLLETGAVFGKVQAINKPLVYYRQTGNNVRGAVTETTTDKLLRNATNLAKGFFAKKRAFINEARDFAREIIKLQGISEEKRIVLEEFVNIGSKPKLYRMKFYKENNFTRAHHNLWMRLWV